MVFIVSNPQRDENAKRKGWLFIIHVLTDFVSHINYRNFIFLELHSFNSMNN